MMDRSLDERLSLAMDSNHIRQVLTSHVPAVTFAAGPNRVDGCCLERVRYRAGEKATLSYAVTLTAPGDRRTELPVTGYLYRGGKARRLHKRLKGNTWYDADLGLLLQCFPQDFRIPHLAELAQSPPGWIREALLAQTRGRGSNVTLTAHPLRYRPGIGATFKCTAVPVSAPNPPQNPSVFCKVYRDPHSTLSAFRNASAFARATQDLRAGLSAQAPMMHHASHSVILYPQAHGSSMDTAARTDLFDAMPILARRLATLHRSPAILPAIVTRQAREMEAGRTLGAIERLAPGYAPQLARLATCAKFLLQGDLFRPCHMDLKPEHVFMGTNTFTLIDTDTTAMSDPVSDVALLAVRMLDYSCGEPGPGYVSTFLTAYFDAAEPTWRDRFEGNFLYAVLRQSRHLAEHRQPGWENRLDRLLRFAGNPTQLC